MHIIKKYQKLINITDWLTYFFLLQNANPTQDLENCLQLNVIPDPNLPAQIRQKYTILDGFTQLYEYTLDNWVYRGIDSKKDIQSNLDSVITRFVQSTCQVVNARLPHPQPHPLIQIEEYEVNSSIEILTHAIRGKISFVIPPPPIVQVYHDVIPNAHAMLRFGELIFPIQITGRSVVYPPVPIQLKHVWTAIHDYYKRDFLMQRGFLLEKVLPFAIDRATHLSEGERACRLRQVKDLRSNTKWEDKMTSWLTIFSKDMDRFDCPQCLTGREFVEAVRLRYVDVSNWYRFGRSIFSRYENVSGEL